MRDTEDRKPFSEVIEALAAIPGREVSKPLLQAYWIGLQDVELRDVQEGARRWLQSGSGFLPSPGELRKLAGGQTAEMRSLLAWEAVRGAIRRHGAYRTVQFSDPAATAAVRSLGGWVGLCGRDTEELDKFVCRDFRRAYEEFSAAGVTQEMARPLDGIWSTHDRVDPDSVRPRLVPIQVEPARLLGSPAPAGKLEATTSEYVTELVRRAAR
jgi:hypothetical protein